MSETKLSFLAEFNQCEVEKRLYAYLARTSEQASRGDTRARDSYHRVIQDVASLKQDYVTNLEHIVRRAEQTEERV